MKILFVTAEYQNDVGLHPGGLATYVYNASNLLSQKGHDVFILQSKELNPSVVSKLFPSNKLFTLNDNLTKFRNVLKYITFKRFNRTIDWIIESKLLKNAIARLDKKYNFDIIHYSSYKAVGFNRYLKKPAILRVSSIQYFWDLFEGRNLTYDRKLSSFLEIRAMKNADMVVGPNLKILRLLSIKYKVNNIMWVPTPYMKPNNFVECTKDEESNLGKYILFVGTLSLLKGFSFIEKLLTVLISKDIKLLLIGKSNQYSEDKTCLERLFDSIPPDRNPNEVIVYKGVLIRSEIDYYIKNSLCVIIPSLIDNFPNTILEAMFSGGIVIANSRTGAEHIIDNGKDGFIFSNNNLNSFLSKVEYLIDLPEVQRSKIKESIELKVDYWQNGLNPITLLIAAYEETIVKYEKN